MRKLFFSRYLVKIQRLRAYWAFIFGDKNKFQKLLLNLSRENTNYFSHKDEIYK